MEKIAIIGLSCLFPDAQDPEQFWQNLLLGKNSISQATSVQMAVNPDLLYVDPTDKEQLKKLGDKYYCKQGGYIKNFKFDPTGYRIAPEQLEKLDDLYQWSLYVSQQALKDSGYLEQPSVLKSCGVILGNLSLPSKLSNRLISRLYDKAMDAEIQKLLQQPEFSLENLLATDEISFLNTLTAGYPSALIAQALSLSGIHFSLDAACASSLYAIKLACYYLSCGKADLMLAGAVNGADPFLPHAAFSVFHAYPKTGKTRPLDQFSDGMMTGEGAGMFVLKRYSDALKDGDKIYATLLGIGLANDGKGKHFLTPNPQGQLLALENAYAEADISPNSIDYIEAHATGTPLGDPIELNSIATFWGSQGKQPKLGSVKSNLGHLLTAAGMPSILKVILSLDHGLIPPTINVENPQSENVITQTTPWPSAAGVRRAAVNAFGFGGTNSHLILESHDKRQNHDINNSSQRNPLGKMAIVGMDAFFGSYQGLDAFEQSIYQGNQSFTSLPKTRWWGLEAYSEFLKSYQFSTGEAPQGSYIEGFDLDHLYFKIPPHPAEQPIPQQPLVLKVADQAIKDAQLTAGSNVAVVIAMGTELSSHKLRARSDLFWKIKEGLEKAQISLSPDQVSELEKLASDTLMDSYDRPAQPGLHVSIIGNIMASRICSLWDFKGPSFTVSAEENSVFKALEIAQLLLYQEKVDAVVLGAVDLAGGIENVVFRQQIAPVNTGVNTLSFDRQANGWLVGEGAGAVVLKRSEQAESARERIYAMIDAVSLVQDNTNPETLTDLPQAPTADLVIRACQQAFEDAKVQPEDIGYLEVFGSGIPPEDEAEMGGLTQAYQTSQADLRCAMGSVKANIGHTYCASGIASLIKTALCLYHQYIPPVPHWSGPKEPQRWQKSPFYIAPQSRPWYLPPTVSRRIAAINGLGIDRTYAHVILSEASPKKELSLASFPQFSAYLFPLGADSSSDLLNQLHSLRQNLKTDSSLSKIANQTFQAFGNYSNRKYALAIIGNHREQLDREIELALEGIPKAFEQGKDWLTPQGSYFTPNPLGEKGGIAFVYPGGFTAYPGLARGMLRLFPANRHHLARFSEPENVKALIYQATSLIFPRSLEKLSKRQLEKLEMKLLQQDPISMLYSGTIAAIGFTIALKDYFKVKPQFAFGYSIGEFSMMFALDIWERADRVTDKLNASPLFKNRVSGPKKAVQEYWGLSSHEQLTDPDFWRSYILMSPEAEVREALKSEERVYLMIVNSPIEMVIGGETEACLRVIQKLQCLYFPAPFSHAIHCEAMESEFDQISKILTIPVKQQSPVAIYSAAHYATTDCSSHLIAHNMAKSFCTPLDYPRLINKVYEDGARIFIELGAGAACSRWINETLKEKERLALSINTRGVDDDIAMVRVLAKFLSHRVSLDLSPLYPQSDPPVVAKKSFVKTLMIGGNPISSMVNPENWKKLTPQAVNSTFSPSSSEKLPSESVNSTFHPSQKNKPTKNMTNTAVKNEARGDQALYVPVSSRKSANILFDEADLQEFAVGQIANVFGSEYAEIDSYPHRVRIPMNPYLFISRVTQLDAKRGCFEPCSIETEYDIPEEAWYAINGAVPTFMVLEASHANMFLVSYLGIDFEVKGQQFYRTLGGTVNFTNKAPKLGTTFTVHTHIKSFIKNGKNRLFFYTCNYYSEGKHFLELEAGGGFFSIEQLQQVKGITLTKREKEARSNIKKQSFQPLLTCQKSTFNERDIQQLAFGNLAACFGESYEQNGLNSSLKLQPISFRMLDRVTSVDPQGGPWGLGFLIGEKDLDPEHWYFHCHFKDDWCVPGTLILEGILQLMNFYVLYLGLQTQTTNAIYENLLNSKKSAINRGQILPCTDKITYHLEVAKIGLKPEPYLMAHGLVIFQNKVIARYENLAVKLLESSKF